MKLLIASANKNKIAELREILANTEFEIISALDIDAPEVIEDKETIKGNAIKKAMELANYSSMLTLADDTGLFVEALAGSPGVHSARYAGENCSYADNRQKMLSAMKNENNRHAYFTTVIALARPDSLIATVEGRVDGNICKIPRGEGGFGYDPIFEAIESGLTFSEMTASDKHKISHRGRAITKIIPILTKEL